MTHILREPSERKASDAMGFTVGQMNLLSQRRSRASFAKGLRFGIERFTHNAQECFR